MYGTFNPLAICLKILLTKLSNCDVGWSGSKALKSTPFGKLTKDPASTFMCLSLPTEASPSPVNPSPSGDVKNPILLALVLDAINSASKYPFNCFI